MEKERIDHLRSSSRKIVRELGMLQLSKGQQTPQHWHALIEIAKEPNITISKLGHHLLLSVSATSRLIDALIKHGFVNVRDGVDKREKYIHLTEKGQLEIKNIDEFSNIRIRGAFEFLSDDDQEQLITALHKYGEALEKSRLSREQVKIRTLSTSRPQRQQIIKMIENIQKNEFLLPITPEINACVLKAEKDFYFNKAYNFWYALDGEGKIIGSIGLKKIDDKSAEIKKFFVDKKYRGKGVAQKLLNTLFKAANKHEFSSLYLGTVSLLKAAQKFYEKCGFTPISQQDLPRGFQVCPLDTVFYKANVKEAPSDIAHL
jgi:DNA-binding MarR family transcriptional regulator/N-acetylglutamate synthase-like GNAT family acetyltransferase